MTGTVYLLHFDRPYRHARHYLGWTDDLDARLVRHANGRGARLLEVVHDAGIGWTLARTWPGTRARERRIKNQGGASRYCPLCGIRPRPDQGNPTMNASTRPQPAYDHYGRYLLPHPDTGEETAWTRATTWARTVTDTTGLTRWQCRMVAAGIAARPDLYHLAAHTPTNDKHTLDKLCEEAKHAAGASAGADRGTALHKLTERADRGERIDDVPAPWAADLAAYQAALRAAGISLDPAHIERTVLVPELHVAGTLDRIATVPDVGPVIADIKTAADLTMTWGEIAIQLAIYAHGCGLWNGPGYDPIPPIDQDRALVIHLPAGQARCELHWIDIAAGWKAAQLCAAVRAWRNRRNHATPFTDPAHSRQAHAGTATPTDHETAGRTNLR